MEKNSITIRASNCRNKAQNQFRVVQQSWAERKKEKKKIYYVEKNNTKLKGNTSTKRQY